MPPTLGAAMLPHVRPGASGPHDRDQPDEHRRHGHELRTQPLCGAFHDPRLEVGERGPQPRGADRESAFRVAVNHQCGNVIARSSLFANGIAACLLASTVHRSQPPMAREQSIPVLAECPTPGRQIECRGEDYSYNEPRTMNNTPSPIYLARVMTQ